MSGEGEELLKNGETIRVSEDYVTTKGKAVLEHGPGFLLRHEKNYKDGISYHICVAGCKYRLTMRGLTVVRVGRKKAHSHPVQDCWNHCLLKENKDEEAISEIIQNLVAVIDQQPEPPTDALGQFDPAHPCSSNLVSSDREPHSGAYSEAMIKDIDQEDREDPKLVADYVNYVYIYLRHLEKQQSVKEDYLSGQKEITGKMRAILIDWLVQVHIRFHLLPETLYMTIMLIDRYLQSAATVPKSKLQLVGVSAMFVASKYEEMFAPEIGDFAYITDYSYRCQEIRLMEIEILKILKFEIAPSLPIHFLRRFSKAAEADADIHSMAKYFMELCIVEYSMCHFLPSMKAAAALWISLKVLVQDKWCDTLIHYTGYREGDIMPCVRKMSRLIYKTHSGQTKFQSVRNKFATNRFRSISKHRSLENMEQIKIFGEGAQL